MKEPVYVYLLYRKYPVGERLQGVYKDYEAAFNAVKKAEKGMTNKPAVRIEEWEVEG